MNSYLKNQLIRIGNRNKIDMCMLGQRRVKILLNSLSKTGDLIAAMYRLALEIENCNINAKKYKDNKTFNYSSYYYKLKHKHLLQLVELVEKYNEQHQDDIIVYGIQESDIIEPPYVCYFELPGMEQISFHSYSIKANMPTYSNDWDEKVNSTLWKIEQAIMCKYSSVMKCRYGIDVVPNL